MPKKYNLHQIRQKRIRAKLRDTDRLRFTVYRSNKAIYAQIIDDRVGKTLVADKQIGKTKKDAFVLGQAMAAAAKKKKITRVLFDRNGYRYHGVIATLAEALRKGGLEF